MIVLQRPSAVELAAQMTDYIIDTDVTISFSVQFKGQTILSEEYVRMRTIRCASASSASSAALLLPAHGRLVM